MLACAVFSLAPSLRSTNSGSGRPTPFAGFAATMERSDFSPLCIIGFGLRDDDYGGRLTTTTMAGWGSLRCATTITVAA